LKAEVELTMVANALLITIALLLAYGVWLSGELKFMAAFRALLLATYWKWILGSAMVLFFNVFSTTLLVCRKFLLKNTGRKLSHLDRQFQLRQTDFPAADHPWEDL
jgi:hypothetical protein